MSTLYHMKANFRATSGSVKDDASMSMSFICQNPAANPPDEVGLTIADAFMTTFINDTKASGFALSDILGKSLSRTANDVTVGVYGPLSGEQLKGAIKGQPATYMGSPVYEDLYTIGSAGPATEMARQVAIDLVFRAAGWEVAPVEAADGTDADTKVDRPKQRLTGRVKVGPIGSAFAIEDTAHAVRPTAGLVATLIAAADELRDFLHAHASAIDLAVWSRANQSFVAVTDVQVPNAFSQVIRRKPAVTARTTTAID